MVEPAHTLIPLSPIRRIIAARMTHSKQTIPHYRLVADIEIDALATLREQLHRAHPEARLSLNALIIKACAGALIDVPELNVQWVEGGILHYDSVDISIVTAIDGGVSTPIIRNADSKTIWEIGREVRELADRASRNRLTMDEIVGGTFSISNLGMHGVLQFDAIINPPQCAILAVGCGRPNLRMAADGSLATVTLLRVTLSVDHRAIDGLVAARFLSALRLQLEHPAHLNREEPGAND